MITCASQADTAHVMVPAVMTPRAKVYDSSAGRRAEEVGRRQCRDGSESLNHDLSQELRRQLASQVSAAPAASTTGGGPGENNALREAQVHASSEQHERQLDREEAHRLQVSTSNQRREGCSHRTLFHKSLHSPSRSEERR